MRRRVVWLTVLGAVVGPLMDRAHAWTGAIVYDTPVTWLGVPWWVTLVYVGAALGIGLTHPALDGVLRRAQKVELTPRVLVGGSRRWRRCGWRAGCCRGRTR
ncbi:MAG: hypothetical protein R3B70_26260 [Polyangiaceae bacterium]